MNHFVPERAHCSRLVWEHSGTRLRRVIDLRRPVPMVTRPMFPGVPTAMATFGPCSHGHNVPSLSVPFRCRAASRRRARPRPAFGAQTPTPRRSASTAHARSRSVARTCSSSSLLRMCATSRVIGGVPAPAGAWSAGWQVALRRRRRARTFTRPGCSHCSSSSSPNTPPCWAQNISSPVSAMAVVHHSHSFALPSARICS
jgi:hypothetical protein